MTTICITHGDVDGMTCAAQVLRREQLDCEVIYSNARYLTGTLRRVVAQAPSRLYITDLPASEASLLITEPLAAQGTEILWVDHHEWPDGVLEKMRQAGIQVLYQHSLQTPAGILLGRHLANEDPFCDQIGRICYASTHGAPWERQWFMRISDCVGHCPGDVLERLARDDAFTAEDWRAIERFQQREATAQQVLAEQVRIETTAQQRLMAVYDTAGIPGLYLGKKVFSQHQVHLCLHRIAATKWQLAVAPGMEIDLQPLITHGKVACPDLHIGGRRYQLYALDYAGDPAGADMHERIILIIRDSL